MENLLIRDLLIAILIILIVGIGYLSLLSFEKDRDPISPFERFMLIVLWWLFLIGYIFFGHKIFEELESKKRKKSQSN